MLKVPQRKEIGGIAGHMRKMTLDMMNAKGWSEKKLHSILDARGSNRRVLVYLNEPQ
jgi:hypothetical protein